MDLWLANPPQSHVLNFPVQRRMKYLEFSQILHSTCSLTQAFLYRGDLKSGSETSVNDQAALQLQAN